MVIAMAQEDTPTSKTSLGPPPEEAQVDYAGSHFESPHFFLLNPVRESKEV